MKRSSSVSSSDSSDTSDSDSAADNKKKREEEEEDLWQHLTYWTVESEEDSDDSEQLVMDQDNNDCDGRVFAKIYAVDAENGATTEQLIELFDPFFDDGGVTDSELMMVCLVSSGSLYYGYDFYFFFNFRILPLVHQCPFPH